VDSVSPHRENLKKKTTVTKPPKPMEEDHGRGQDPYRVAATTEKMKGINRV
jgi:hypothetical protein